jgi:hypothetical protein
MNAEGRAEHLADRDRSVGESTEHGNILAHTEEVGDAELFDSPVTRDAAERVDKGALPLRGAGPGKDAL